MGAKLSVGDDFGLGLVRGLLVEGRVGEIDVFGVQFFLAEAQTFSKSLEVHDLPLPQESDDIVYIRVVR